MQEKVSIIVPIYNVEKYIVECLESLVNQTYKNLEIILVDDGSPDKCPQICDEWAKKDARIKVLHKKNGGLMDAWMRGVKLSTGEFVTFVDSDDFIEPNFVETLYATLKDNGADVSICDYYEYRDGDKFLKSQLKQSQIFESTENFNCVELFSRRFGMVHSRLNKMYKRNLVLDAFKYLDSKVTMGEDLNLTFCVFSAATKVAYRNSALYAYRILNGSMSHVKKDFWPSYQRVLMSISTYIEENNCNKNIKNVFYEYVHKFFYYSAKHYYSCKEKERFYELLNCDLLKKHYWKSPCQGSRHMLFKVLYKLKMYNIMYNLMKF